MVESMFLQTALPLSNSYPSSTNEVSSSNCHADIFQTNSYKNTMGNNSVNTKSIAMILALCTSANRQLHITQKTEVSP